MKRFPILMPILFFSSGVFAQSENGTSFMQSRNTTAKEVSANNSFITVNESTLLPEVNTNQRI